LDKVGHFFNVNLLKIETTFMNTLITIKEASDLLGVSTKTLRRWEKQGKISPTRTPGGHRRFRTTDVLFCHHESPPHDRLVVGYARVSDLAQQIQLDQQIQALETFCRQQGDRYEIIHDIGNGVTHQRSGLLRLIEMICERKVQCLVLTSAERLSRFSTDLMFGLCNHFSTQVVILNQSEDLGAEVELVQDIQEIITLCYNRLYGLRDPEHPRLLLYLQTLKELQSAWPNFSEHSVLDCEI
jgi:putative resolvase